MVAYFPYILDSECQMQHNYVRKRLIYVHMQ